MFLSLNSSKEVVEEEEHQAFPEFDDCGHRVALFDYSTENEHMSDNIGSLPYIAIFGKKRHRCV